MDGKVGGFFSLTDASFNDFEKVVLTKGFL